MMRPLVGVLNHNPLVYCINAPEDGKLGKVTKDSLMFSGESGTEYKYPMKTVQGDMKLLAKASGKINKGDLGLTSATKQKDQQCGHKYYIRYADVVLK